MPVRRFDAEGFLPKRTYDKISELRVEKPDTAVKAAAARVRRKRLTTDGKLTLLAVDHPARMVTGIRGDPLRMARRHELLSRTTRVLACSPFDGILGTADIFDDLLTLDSKFAKESFLNGKLMIGSVNRGGLAGATFELDDRVTGYDAKGIEWMNLDAAKFLLRIDPEDKGSLKTLEYCAETVRECTAKGIPIFVEPLPVVTKDGKVKGDYQKEKLVRLAGVASALGSSTSRVWLKLPYCEGFDEVAGATTLPIVLLGGEASDDVTGLLREIETAMKSGPNVRGVLMGRNLLYPPGDDPLPLAMAVHAVVHEGKKAEAAAKSMDSWSGKRLDVFSSND